MRGDWGQGAHNALYVVGDFFRQSLKAKLIDARLRFAAPPHQGAPDPLFGPVNNWLGGMFQNAPESQRVRPPVFAPAVPAPASPAQSQPVFEVPLVVEPPPVPRAERILPLPESIARAPLTSGEATAPRQRPPVRIDRLPRILVTPDGAIAQPPQREGEAVPMQWPQSRALPELPPPARASEAQELGAATASEPDSMQ